MDFLREWKEGGRGKERGGRETTMGERHIEWLLPPHTQTGVGIEPTTQVGALDWETNPGPFRAPAGARTTEPRRPG